MATEVEKENARHVERLRAAQIADETARAHALMEVTSSANALEEAQGNYMAALRLARKKGCSLRAIADAAGRNHESIRRLVGERA